MEKNDDGKERINYLSYFSIFFALSIQQTWRRVNEELLRG